MISIDAARQISAWTGWVYTFLWSACMYPQPILNWQRQSVEGLSIEFCAYNFFGFGFYSIYTLAFYCWDVAQEEYNVRHQTTKNLVCIQDVIFAVHCWVFTVFAFVQIEQYKKPGHYLSLVGKLICATVTVVTIVVCVWCGFDIKHRSYDIIIAMGYGKIFMSTIKYIPQVYTNWQYKSTDGWSIWNVLTDLSGGVLSIIQLGLDAWIDISTTAGSTISWTERFFNGNSTKLGLASMCMAYDVVLMWQHYVLYRKPAASHDDMSKSRGIDDKPKHKELDV